MKVIDLLNKITNGEEVPEKIKHINNVWFYNETNKDYCRNSGSFIYWLTCSIFDSDMPTKDILNEEIEIIEEPKRIEKITWEEKESLAGIETSKTKIEILARRTEKIKKSLNKIIDYINKGE